MLGLRPAPATPRPDPTSPALRRPAAPAPLPRRRRPPGAEPTRLLRPCVSRSPYVCWLFWRSRSSGPSSSTGSVILAFGGAASGRFSPTFRRPRLNWSAGPRADRRSALGRHVIALGATGPLYRALGAPGLHPFWPWGRRPQDCIGCGPGGHGARTWHSRCGGRILGPAIVRNNASARSRAELATMYVRR
jgi:hypothetical protein